MAPPTLIPSTARGPPARGEPGGGIRVEIQERYRRLLHVLQSCITDARRAEPGADLATVIANGQIDGMPINDFEAMSYYVIVATAGHDTTSSSTAGAVWGMYEFPEAFAKVKADPSLIPGLVDESVRWVTPVKHFMRSAREESRRWRPEDRQRGLDVAGLSLSGNRDEAVFDEPNVFKPGAPPEPPFGLRLRAPTCAWASISRSLKMRILFEELMPRA